MPYKFYNPNPSNIRVGDCVIRALSKALQKSWEDIYVSLCAEGLLFHDMPSSDYVWGMYLKKNGFQQKMVESICPDCTTVQRFADSHPDGTYVVKTQSHVICIRDGGCWWDSWNSGDEIVLYFWQKEE